MKKLIFSWSGTAKTWRSIMRLREHIEGIKRFNTRPKILNIKKEHDCRQEKCSICCPVEM